MKRPLQPGDVVTIRENRARFEVLKTGRFDDGEKSVQLLDRFNIPFWVSMRQVVRVCRIRRYFSRQVIHGRHWQNKTYSGGVR